MKGLKKLLTGILAGAMAFTMALSTGNAAQVKAAGKGTITIENAIAGQTYAAYRLFDYIPADDENADNGGVYKLSSKFSGFTYDEYFSVNEDDQVLVFKGDLASKDKETASAAAAKLGKAALEYAKTEELSSDGETEAKIPEGGKAGDKVTATIEVNGFGYYVVDSSLGTAVAVDTTTPNVTIKEKNDVPGLDKKVTGATNKSTIYTDMTGNNAQIGDTVEFTIEADFKVGGEKYKIVDTVTKGLTLDLDSIQVDFSDNVSMKYTKTAITKTVNGVSRNGFQLAFDGEPSANTKVTVTYSAVVNKDAEINPGVNINEAYLIYGSDAETTHITTETKTYPLMVKKIAKGTEQENDPAILGGAIFEMYRQMDDTQLSFLKEDATKEVYTVVPAGTEGAVTEITTVKDVPFTINGLNAENYILVETKAPEGYNLLESSVGDYTHAQLVTVSTTSTVTAPQVEKVIDATGLTLPSTGGIGTTIFYIIGGVLIVAGIAYFILRRKSSAQ